MRHTILGSEGEQDGAGARSDACARVVAILDNVDWIRRDAAGHISQAWVPWSHSPGMLYAYHLHCTGCTDLLGVVVKGLSSVLTGLALEWVEHRVHDFRLTFFGALLCTAASMSCLAATQWSNSAYLLLSFFSGCGSAVLTHSPRCITWRVLSSTCIT